MGIQVGRTSIGLVVAVDDVAEAAGIMQWDFINMVRVPCSLTGSGLGAECTGDYWWLSYSYPTWPAFQTQISQIWLNDELADHTQCVDDSTWKDSKDYNCGNYTTNVWCEDHGVATPEFTNATNATELIDLAVDGFFAAHMCCLCGGGYHEAPPDAATQSIYQ